MQGKKLGFPCFLSSRFIKKNNRKISNYYIMLKKTTFSEKSYLGLHEIFLIDKDPSYWSIALQMEHCFFFCNIIKSKMGILNLIQKIYFIQKTLTKNIF